MLVSMEQSSLKMMISEKMKTALASLETKAIRKMRLSVFVAPMAKTMAKMAERQR